MNWDESDVTAPCGDVVTMTYRRPRNRWLVPTKRVLLLQAAAILVAVIVFSAASSSLSEILTNAGVTILFLVPGALARSTSKRPAITRQSRRSPR